MALVELVWSWNQRRRYIVPPGWEGPRREIHCVKRGPLLLEWLIARREDPIQKTEEQREYNGIKTGEYNRIEYQKKE